MKPKKTKKLELTKVTITNLNNKDMLHLNGGGTEIPVCPPPTRYYTYCYTLCVTNCLECPPDPTW